MQTPQGFLVHHVEVSAQIVAGCVLTGTDHMEAVTSVVLVFNDCVLDSCSEI